MVLAELGSVGRTWKHSCPGGSLRVSVWLICLLALRSSPCLASSTEAGPANCSSQVWTVGGTDRRLDGRRKGEERALFPSLWLGWHCLPQQLSPPWLQLSLSIPSPHGLGSLSLRGPYLISYWKSLASELWRHFLLLFLQSWDWC